MELECVARIQGSLWSGYLRNKKCSKKPQSKKQQRHLGVVSSDLLEAMYQSCCENAERQEKTNGYSLPFLFKKVQSATGLTLNSFNFSVIKAVKSS